MFVGVEGNSRKHPQSSMLTFLTNFTVIYLHPSIHLHKGFFFWETYNEEMGG